MDILSQFGVIYISISLIIAAFWGRTRQTGFWWTLFLMSGFLPGWIIIFNDDIRIDKPAPISEAKKNSGIFIIIMSSFFLWLVYRNRYEIHPSDIVLLTAPLIWFVVLGYYLFQRGRGIVFNRKNIPTPQKKQKNVSAPVSPPPPKHGPEPISESNPIPKANAVPKSQPPKVVSSISGCQLKVLNVDYDGTAISQKINISSYPVLKFPKKKGVVRSHREGRVRKRGYKEESFQVALSKYFQQYFEVSGLVQIFTGSRPYEPDIALIDKRIDGCIRIDIEIDEPYDGVSRKAIHCSGDDEARDIYFVDRGWIVIRFSEYQVHSQERSCLKFVADILSIIHPEFSIPTELHQAPSLRKESFWDLLQAQKWEKEKYREGYLDHEFSETQEVPGDVIGDLNLREQEEEYRVNSTYTGKPETVEPIAFNAKYNSSRDKRIEFYPEKHIYLIDGVPAVSVSTVIERRFPTFDAKYWARKKSPYSGMSAEALEEKWRKNGEEALKAGTLLHQQIENFFLKNQFKESGEMNLFRQFIHDHPDLEPNRTEWRIFDERYRIAGTIDLLAKNGENYEIYDWKRSKKVVDLYTGEPITCNAYQSGFGGLSGIPDTSFNKYCIQQGLYRYILEYRYDIKIAKMFIVVLYPDYDQYYKLEVPYLKNEVEYILKTI